MKSRGFLPNVAATSETGGILLAESTVAASARRTQAPPGPLAVAMKASRGAFVAVAVFSGFINILMLTVPLYMLQIFDRVLSSRSTDTLLLLFAMATLALLVLGLLDAIRTVLMVRIGDWLDQRLGGLVLSETIAAHAGGRSGPEPAPGAPGAQGLRDLATLRGFLAGPAVLPLLDAPWVPVFIVVIFLLHPLLGWFSLAGAILLFLLAVLNEWATHAPMRQAERVHAASQGVAEGAVRHADVIESMGMMPHVIRRWRALSVRASDHQGQASLLGGSISTTSRFFRFLLQIGILTVGAWLVLQGTLTPGGMIAGSILMARALGPVEQAIGSWSAGLAAREAHKRLAMRMATPARRYESTNLPAPSGRVDAEALVYAPVPGGEPLLRDVTFRLEPGQQMAIIGPTAAGKTTLARIIVGVLKPDRGHLRIDGLEASAWQHDALGPWIGYLPQDVGLFAGSVRDNIARLGPSEDEAVIRAARMAGVHDMVMRMPKGYDTQIAADGESLSGGQRQRLGLARALYGQPRLVVMDEPDAHLDGDGEMALAAALKSLRAQGTTVILIAHRPTLLPEMDRILLLRPERPALFGESQAMLQRIAEARKGAVPPPADSARGALSDG